MMTSDAEKSPPVPSGGDRLHAAGRAVLGAIPYAGPPAAELLSALVQPPLEKRLQRWRADVGERLTRLGEAGLVDLHDLQDDEAFVSVLMQASQVAVKNHQELKLQALRNAVLNTAARQAPDEALQQMFVQMVDGFTSWHLRILHLFQDPPGWFRREGRPVPTSMISSSISQVLAQAFPELKDQRDLYELVFEELEARGLYAGGSPHTMMTASGALEPRVTSLGAQFLRFITAPAGADEDR